jgi:hypothetical protein
VLIIVSFPDNVSIEVYNFISYFLYRPDRPENLVIADKLVVKLLYAAAET